MDLSSELFSAQVKQESIHSDFIHGRGINILSQKSCQHDFNHTKAKRFALQEFYISILKVAGLL